LIKTTHQGSFTMNKVVLFLAIAFGLTFPASAQWARQRDVPAIQNQLMVTGTQQALATIDAARALCEATGGALDPNRVRIRASTETQSRFRDRNRRRGSNTIVLNLFGPRAGQQYDNDMRIGIDVGNACRRK
jgi:hypothetical protein